jgi:Uma2 family endonuclease
MRRIHTIGITLLLACLPLSAGTEDYITIWNEFATEYNASKEIEQLVELHQLLKKYPPTFVRNERQRELVNNLIATYDRRGKTLRRLKKYLD